MNGVFQEVLRKFVLVFFFFFFDDILVYSLTREVHWKHLDRVFEILKDNHLVVKKKKWEEVHYLSHIICVGGMKVDPEKIEAMQSWPQPKSVRELRGFLGLTGYYRLFITGYGQIPRPLTDLLKKVGFKWQQEVSEAFERLKQTMIKAPVLALLDFEQEFMVECDSSMYGVGVVLM